MYKQGSSIDLKKEDWYAEFYADDTKMPESMTINYKKKTGFIMAVPRDQIADTECFKCCLFDGEGNMLQESKTCRDD